jgi:hypothetical protein
MSAQETKKLRLADLKQGDIIWSNYKQDILEFEELIEDYGYCFKNINGVGFVFLVSDDIEHISDLMKELL